LPVPELTSDPAGRPPRQRDLTLATRRRKDPHVEMGVFPSRRYQWLSENSKIRFIFLIYKVLADAGAETVEIPEETYMRKPHALAGGLNPWFPGGFNANAR